MTTYYKLLNKDGTTPQGYGRWPLPKQNGDPGEWLPPIEGKLVACKHGYHVLKFENLLEWPGPMLVEVEVKGRAVRAGNKSVVRQARTMRTVKEWNSKNLRLFVADCAERVLLIWEKKYPDDDRPHRAIRAARAFAKGKISFKKMSVAYSAAYSAADSAAVRAVDGAAYRAAYRAAYSAAYSAADSVAYRAAYRAAYSAAYSAAVSATDSAFVSGTYSVTYSVAYMAVYSAERKWQLKRLKEYIEGTE